MIQYDTSSNGNTMIVVIYNDVDADDDEDRYCLNSLAIILLPNAL